MVLLPDKPVHGRRPQTPASGPGRGGHNSTGERDEYRMKTLDDYWNSPWGKDLKHPDLTNASSRRHREFEIEFRVPYAIFDQIVRECEDRPWARNSTSANQKQAKARGRVPVPIEFKVMAVLYRLGCGCLPRTSAKLFGMSRSQADDFFKHFCAHYAQNYYKYCTLPQSETEMRDVEAAYARMGFPGCLGSVDGVHVAWDKCPHRLQARHKGSKQKPTRTFNVTVDHRKFIRHVASSKPGSVNDKTSVRYDPHLVRVRNGLYKHFRYTLRGQERVGGYLLADGGYHKWRCLQCPRPHDSRPFMKTWSAALESIRKDVECTFGK